MKMFFALCLFPLLAAGFSVHAQTGGGETVRSRAERRFSSFAWTERDNADNADAGGADSAGAPRADRMRQDGARPDGDLTFGRIDSPLPFRTLRGASDASFAGVPPLTASGASALPAIAPEIPGAGLSSRSAAPEELLSFFNEVAVSLKSADFADLPVAENSRFLPVFLASRMEKLPAPDDVYFAGVLCAADGLAARCVFRLRFPSRTGTLYPVFAVAEAVRGREDADAGGTEKKGGADAEGGDEDKRGQDGWSEDSGDDDAAEDKNENESGVWKLRDVIFDSDSYARAVRQAGLEGTATGKIKAETDGQDEKDRQGTDGTGSGGTDAHDAPVSPDTMPAEHSADAAGAGSAG